MDKYFTLKSVEQLGSPYQVNGKLYTRAKRKCGKCGGTGQYLHFGECYTCHGTGYVIEEVRLYTKEEMVELRAQVREELKSTEAEDKARWLTRHNFTADGRTYIVLGDSFLIKDHLKELGFQYSDYIKWHAPSCADAAVRVQEIQIDDFYAWAPGTKSYVITAEGRDRFAAMYADEPLNSEWYGSVGEKITRVKVTLHKTRVVTTDWGDAVVFSFVDADKHLFSWRTMSAPDIPSGEFYLTAAIKSHGTCRNGDKVTYIQRAKLEVS